MTTFKCEICSKEVSVRMRKDAKNRFCSKSCAGRASLKIANKRDRRREKNPFWRGGKTKAKIGYILLNENKKKILEHRRIMELHIGRPLLSSEIIHHINGKKDDNRIENLELLSSQSEHIIKHDFMALVQSGRQKWLAEKHEKECGKCRKLFIMKSGFAKYCNQCRNTYGYLLYKRTTR